MPILSWALVLLVAGSTLASAQTRVLTEAPGRGALRAGERVLVDDRSCPEGQIREITGGSNAGSRDARQAPQPRQSRCIPRP